MFPKQKVISRHEKELTTLAAQRGINSSYYSFLNLNELLIIVWALLNDTATV